MCIVKQVNLVNDEAFAVWLTGLPASGKSSIAKELALRLEHLRAAVLESDALRPIFTPEASYDERDREHFYRQISFVAALLVRHGIPVIIDATANLRSYRQHARHQIPKFLEVYVDTPLDVCLARDPKGIYRNATEGGSGSVPGLQAPYEPPEAPDVIVHGAREPSKRSTDRIIEHLHIKNFLD
jgi:adenylylsulfate kinase